MGWRPSPRKRGEGVLARGGGAPCGRSRDAWYAVTQATERELGDVAWAAFRLGDDLQRGLVDVAFDAATFSVRDLLSRASRLIGDVQGSAAMLGAPHGVDLAWQQARNNLEVYNLVKTAPPRLHVDGSGDVDLAAAVAEAYALGPYADLWAIEGLGHDYTAFRLDRDNAARGILRDGPAAALPARCLTMMHAGLGLALAERLLPRLMPCDSAHRTRDVIETFVAACDAHGRPGFVGAAYESLGLVARTWHPAIVGSIDIALRAASLDGDDTLAGYFWHGAGRALYFLPAYIVPVLSPWKAAAREAPDALARRNLFAGLAWAWTLVNMRQPSILAGLLRSEGDALLRDDAFVNGVASALVVRSDITPGDPLVQAFVRYVPGDASVAAVWTATIAPAARAAVRWYHPVLRDRGALDQVFRYADLASLTARLAAPLATRAQTAHGTEDS